MPWHRRYAFCSHLCQQLYRISHENNQNLMGYALFLFLPLSRERWGELKDGTSALRQLLAPKPSLTLQLVAECCQNAKRSSTWFSFFFLMKGQKNGEKICFYCPVDCGEGGREILLNKKCFYKIEMRTFTRVQEWVISSDKN